MTAKLAWQGVLGGLFVLAGAMHFVAPAAYVKIMPPYLPAPRLLVLVSGVCEVGLGALMFTRWAPWAAWGLIALLVAVFPANIHMALHPELTPKAPPLALWARLPFQAVFIAWAYWFTRR